MRLSVKVSLYITAVLAFAVGLIVLLNTAKFRSVYEEVQRSRLAVIGLDLKQTIERGFTLGLTLDQLSNISDIVARIQQRTVGLTDLRVVDATGQTLYRAGDASSELPIEDGLRRLRGAGATATEHSVAPQSINSEEALGLMVPLVNTFGQTVGAVTLALDKAPLDRATYEFARRLAFHGLVALAIGGLLTLLMAEIYLRRITRRFSAMTRSVESFLEGEEVERMRQEGGGEMADLEERLARVQARAAALAAELRLAEARLKKQ